MKRILLCALVLAAAVAIARSSTSTPMAPPFGLSWTETRSHLSELINDAHATLVDKKAAKGREIWTTQGFDQPGLSAVVFYFNGELLDEVELQYGDPTWTLNELGQLMGQVKQDLDAKYGRPEVLAHSRDLAQNLEQTFVGYRWQQPEQALDLVFFSAERESRAYRVLSVHYKKAHHQAGVG